MRGLFHLSCAALAASLATSASGAEPHRSTQFLPSSNGRAAIAWDASAFKLTQFLEHPYRYPQAGQESRNFAFDSYPGVRVGASAAWLATVAPGAIDYVQNTGIVHASRTYAGLTVDEYDFAPMSLAENAAFTIVKVTRTGGSGAISVYDLYNFHLGSGGPAPGTDGENLSYDATRDALFEWGPSGVAMGYGSVGASSHHGTTPNNPYASLLAAQDLADNAGTGGATNDAVGGLEAAVGDLPIGGTGAVGFFTVLASDAQAANAVDRVRTWIAGRSAQKVLDDEIADWAGWQKPAPAGATPLEARAWGEAQAMLRMAQVSATDPSDGQILAAVSPGQWNIAWVRDMAYATVALARSGHAAEAKRAIQFQLAGKVGAYQSYVGAPYQISVVRYFGNGTEESDQNADGPNVEFDGFGLFLWELEAYVKASGDKALLDAAWPVVGPKVADVIAKLQEPSGLIAADSSIWEVHWNGKQKHFAYTTITAAQGLCSASRLAMQEGDAAGRAKYLAAGQKARDAVLSSLRAPDGTIAQATESLAANVAWLDAAAVEAIGFGLVDAKKHTAKATLHAIESGLVPPSARGFMRNDSGGWYDSQEWVFVDLRAERSLELSGDLAGAATLLAWNVDQADENFGVFSELHDRVTADYAGAAPMVGFGAGAFSLALLDRGSPQAAGCEAFASEPDEPSDAGPDGASDAADASPPPSDAGKPDASTPFGGNDDQGGGCSASGTSPDSMVSAIAIALIFAGFVLRRRLGAALAGALLLFSISGCSGDDPVAPPGRDAGATDASEANADDAPYDAGPTIDLDAGACTTSFDFTPPAGYVAKQVSVAGEWDGFTAPGTALTGPDEHGAFHGKVALAPGDYAYKLIVDGNWQLDPGSSTRKFVGGVENSRVSVRDCYLPVLTLKSQTLTYAKGQSHYVATVSFVRGAADTQLDTAAVTAKLRNDFAESPAAAMVDAPSETITIDAPALSDGKFSLFVEAKDRKGRSTGPLRLVFWAEPEAFDWRDALIYMAMTDRLKNGDKTNDVGPTVGVDPRADFQNGDLAGVEQVITSGALDQLGVRAIWLTPFYTSTKNPYPASDGVHQVTGYHGYWPVAARAVDPRLGGDAALKSMVKTAHAHGIRVIMDLMLGDVHSEHEYVKAHPDWFINGCVCGTNNCDWTAHRLDCVFATYLPRVDWTNPKVSDQWTSDATYWADTFDLDGFRIDAVKHVQDAAVMNVSTGVRREFEASGTKFFMTGETAMGWSDCGLSCNQSQYDTISRYVGPDKLDGQFDFPLYYAVPMQVFTSDGHGMIHADYWSQASTWEYPQGSIMSPYLGSQDTPRFISIADYRGQDASHDGSIPGNQWSNVAVAPTSDEPYARRRAAIAWLLGQPGAPMIYYGDEYGEWGGADPNNRVMWRGDQALSASEQSVLDLTRKLGQARRDLVALRRGDYRHVYASEAVVVFARQTTAGDVAIVAVSRDISTQSVTVTLPVTLPLAEGTVLHDRLGGPDVKVTGGAVSLTLAPRGSAVLAP